MLSCHLPLLARLSIPGLLDTHLILLMIQSARHGFKVLLAQIAPHALACGKRLGYLVSCQLLLCAYAVRDVVVVTKLVIKGAVTVRAVWGLAALFCGLR